MLSLLLAGCRPAPCLDLCPAAAAAAWRRCAQEPGWAEGSGFSDEGEVLDACEAWLIGEELRPAGLAQRCVGFRAELEGGCGGWREAWQD